MHCELFVCEEEKNKIQAMIRETNRIGHCDDNRARVALYPRLKEYRTHGRGRRHQYEYERQANHSKIEGFLFLRA
jgi:uncharacterized protein YeeX (DUF496 family)